MKNSIFLLVLMLAACVPDMKERGYDTKKLAEEVKDRKIKKITPAQINTWVYERGIIIATALNTELSQKSEAEKQEKKFTLRSLDSLQKAYKVKISLIDLKKENLATQYTGKAKEVIEACIYQAEKGQIIQPNLQKLENQDFFFTALAESLPQHLWQINFNKTEVIKKIDQKEFNP